MTKRDVRKFDKLVFGPAGSWINQGIRATPEVLRLRLLAKEAVYGLHDLTHTLKNGRWTKRRYRGDTKDFAPHGERRVWALIDAVLEMGKRTRRRA